MRTTVPPVQDHALGLLATSLFAAGYRFTTPGPETARRVNARSDNAQANDLAGVFGWTRPFQPEVLPARIFQLATEAGALERRGDLWCSRYRLSTLAGMSFLHSGYPTLAPDAVFFGPDTYRFARALDRAMGHLAAPKRVADIGCGAGVGGMLVARAFPLAEVNLADINPSALRLARINADAAGLAHVKVVESDLLAGLNGVFDLIVSNPPYMADAAGRTYRDGGGAMGEGLSLRIVEEAIRRLAPGGTLLLYTGAAIVNGANPLLDQAGDLLTKAGLTWQFEEIDPDVFGEELEGAGAMAVADRIAVVWLTATKPMTQTDMPDGYLSETVGLAREDSLHRQLAALNRARMTPCLPEEAAVEDRAAVSAERVFLEHAKQQVAERAACAPGEPADFAAWFERLIDDGPGQQDSLFRWLAEAAPMDAMRWFLTQEVAGEAGFEDLTALVQVRMPQRPKLELARNYWDEMGRGQARGMHGPLLGDMARALGLKPAVETTVWESLALANTMAGLAANRCYAFQAIGALGVIELTAPARAAMVAAGLKRLGVATRARHYFSLHAVLDVRHAATWLAEVIRPLIEENPRLARAIAEGALMRLNCGAACFRRYRDKFGIPA